MKYLVLAPLTPLLTCTTSLLHTHAPSLQWRASGKIKANHKEPTKLMLKKKEEKEGGANSDTSTSIGGMR